MIRKINFAAIAGVVLSLIGIGVTIVLFSLGRSDPSLELQTSSAVALAAPVNPLTERIQVFLDGREIEQLWLSTFSLTNTGGSDIGRDDFDGPLLFFAADTNIEDVIGGEADPSEIEFEIQKIDDSTIALSPLLLKGGEIITFSVLSDSRLDRLSVQRRPPIKDIDDIDIKLLLAEVDGRDNLSIASIVALSGSLALLVIALFILIRARKLIGEARDNLEDSIWGLKKAEELLANAEESPARIENDNNIEGTP